MNNVSIANKEFIRRGTNTGIVVVFEGEIAGWMNELRSPNHWMPGVWAIDGDGQCWIAKGGNDYDGAERWESVN